MKRILCLIISLLLLLPCFGIAENLDFSAMSMEELLSIREKLNTEIGIRTAKEENKVVLFEDPNGLTIYLSGKVDVKVGKSLSVEFVLINNGTTDKACYYYTEAINGWESRKWNTMAKALVPGRKAKNTINFYDDEYIDSYDDPITLEFEIFDGESAFDNGESLGKFKVIYSYREDTLSLVTGD